MYKITDISTLGTAYLVSDKDGNVVKTIQVIPQVDILNAALGSYSERFGTLQSYIDKSIEMLSGFGNIDPNKILWYSTLDDEVILSDLLEYAVKFDYDKIILEHIEELE